MSAGGRATLHQPATGASRRLAVRRGRGAGMEFALTLEAFESVFVEIAEK